MTAYSPDACDSFLVAGVGASAALAGLRRDLDQLAGDHRVTERLVRRSVEAFVLLVEVLLVSTLTLVPDIERRCCAHSVRRRRG
jgi:hypothetical protein